MHYLLRDLPPELWARFSDRAGAEGWTKRGLIVHLIEGYVEGTIGAARGAPASRVIVPPTARPASQDVKLLTFTDCNDFRSEIYCADAVMNDAVLEAYDSGGRVIASIQREYVKTWRLADAQEI